ncbi:MAG: alginate export family protein [Candidatus Kapaibacterium sp.]
MKVLTYLMVAAIVFMTDISVQKLLSQNNKGINPEISIGGQIRYRGELDMRFFDMNAKPIFINMLRSRLNAEAIISPNVKAFIQFQDSRNFGEENGRAWRGTLDGSADNLDLHQAYIELNGIGIEDLSIRLGRMMFHTNSERIIGSLEWHNFGRSYDGAWASYKINEGWQTRAFAFLLGTEELLMTSAQQQIPKMVGGLDINFPYLPSGNVYVYYDMNDKAIPGMAPGQESSLPKLSRYTVGAFTKSDKPGFVWELEAALQTGTIDTLPSQRTNLQSDISAWMLSAYGGYKNGAFTIGGGIDVMTGDDPSTDAYEGFDHLFITIHKFYGGMDFFPITVLPSHGIRPGIAGNNSGLIMPNIKGEWIPDERWKFDAVIMMFSTMESYNVNNDEYKDLGTEIDLIASCNITKGVSAQFGSSVFFPGKILKETNESRGLGTDPAFWAYTMLTVNF